MLVSFLGSTYILTVPPPVTFYSTGHPDYPVRSEPIRVEGIAFSANGLERCFEDIGFKLDTENGLNF